MMKKSVIVALLLFSYAIHAKNYFVLIHGISGGIRNFGSLKKVLEAKDVNNAVLGFEYDTESQTKGYLDFAQEFEKFLNQIELKEHDELRFVAHSQGGLISLHVLKKWKDEKNPKLDFVKNVMTLGTPFWGASIAQTALIAKAAGLPGIGRLGKKQLEELELFNEREQQWREYFAFDPAWQELLEQVQLVSLAGDAQFLDAFAVNKQMESDSTVTVASARPDFIYLIKNVTKDDRSEYSLDDFKFFHVSNLKLKMINAFHYLPPKMIGKNIDLVNVPESCIQECKHPTFNTIERMILGTLDEYVFARPIENFSIELNVQTDRPQKISVKMHSLMGQIKIPRANISNSENREESSWHYYQVGSMPSDWTQGEVVIELWKGRSKKIIHSPVKPGHTTYIKIPF